MFRRGVLWVGGMWIGDWADACFIVTCCLIPDRHGCLIISLTSWHQLWRSRLAERVLLCRGHRLSTSPGGADRCSKEGRLQARRANMLTRQGNLIAMNPRHLAFYDCIVGAKLHRYLAPAV